MAAVLVESGIEPRREERDPERRDHATRGSERDETLSYRGGPALDELAHYVAALLLRRFRFLNGSLVEAADLFSGTWILLMRHLPSYDPGGSFDAWVVSMARTELDKQLRKRRRHATEIMVLDGVSDTPEEIVAARLKLDQLFEEMLRALGPERFTIFIRAMDTDLEDLAAETGLTRKQISKSIYRIKEIAKKIFEEHGDE